MRRLYLAQFGYRDGTKTLFKTALANGVEPREILYLTPSPRKLREAQLLFVNLFNKPAVIPPHFATPRQLCRELHESFGSSRLLPDELKPLLIRRILTNLRQQSPLPSDRTLPQNRLSGINPVERPNPVTIGYARAVADFISDTKKYLPVQSVLWLRERLSELLAGYPTPLHRALEACAALACYSDELRTRHRVDNEDIILESTRHIGAEYRPRLLILDSFAAPDPLEQILISALVESAEVTLALGYGTDLTDDNYALPSRFTTFLRSLGQFNVELLPGSEETDRNRYLYRYNTAEDELAGICRHIRENYEYIPPDAIVVAFPRLGDIAPLVHRVFRQYGIPFTIYPETRLASSPPVIAVLELLRAIERDYERIPAAAALSSPFLPELLSLPSDQDPNDRIRAARSINTYSRQAGIIKGRERWRNIAQRMLADADSRPDRIEEEFLADLQNRVRKAIGLVDAILEPAGSFGQQAHRLKQFLETVRFCREFDPTEPLALKFIEDRGTLYDLLDALVSFERDFGAIPESLAEFIRTINFLTNIKLCQPERDYGGATVVSMQETLGISPEMLFFAGLSEADLPGSYPADPILPDRVRTELGMPDMTWYRDWQKFHFSRTLHSSAKQPFLSFHDSRNGQPLLPTPFLEADVVSPPPPRAIYTRREHQLLKGRMDGLLFADVSRIVDFRNDEPVKQTLLRRFGPNYAFPVTGLEAYRRCPFRYYIERILKLSALPEPEFAVDARQWGTIIHSALSHLYENGPVPLSELEEAARSALNKALAAVDLPKFWQQVTRRVFGNLLPHFIANEKQLRAEGFTPVRIESKLQGEVTEEISVQGRIDRVDESPGAYRILDYKTGATADDINAAAVLHKRTHIQLPLYAYLLSQLTRFRTKKVENVGVYSLRNLRIEWLARNTTPLDKLISAAIETTLQTVQAIRSGDFRPEPATTKTCNGCGLSFTCGRQLHQAET